MSTFKIVWNSATTTGSPVSGSYSLRADQNIHVVDVSQTQTRDAGAPVTRAVGVYKGASSIVGYTLPTTDSESQLIRSVNDQLKGTVRSPNSR